MANPIPPMPLRTPIAEKDGMINHQWMAYFREVFNRIGGTSSTSNADLAASVAELQAALLAAETDLNQGRTL